MKRVIENPSKVRNRLENSGKSFSESLRECAIKIQYQALLELYPHNAECKGFDPSAAADAGQCERCLLYRHWSKPKDEQWTRIEKEQSTCDCCKKDEIHFQNNFWNFRKVCETCYVHFITKE